jgi:hypothetical protein
MVIMSLPNEGGAPTSAPVENTPANPADTLDTADSSAAEGVEATSIEGALAKEAAGEKLTKAEKAEIKKWKLKIDGREEELTEDELIKNAQLGKAG